MTLRKLSNPPIVEAVVEFRVKPKEAFEPDIIRPQLEERLPLFANSIQDTREVVHSISLDGSAPKQDNLGCIGFRLLSSDEKFKAHLNKNNFLVSQVKEYQDWRSLTEVVWSAWKAYVDLFQPKEVTRIGVRFINHFRVRGPSIDLKDYYVNPPKENQIKAWELKRFLHKETFGVKGTACMVNLIKTLVASRAENESHNNIVLDVDAFIQQSVKCDESSLNPHLLALRNLKNDAFFSSIVPSKIKEYEK